MGRNDRWRQDTARIEQWKACRHPDHDPRPPLVIDKPGMFEYTCPGCGRKVYYTIRKESE